MTFGDLAVDFLLAFTLGGAIGSLALLLRSPLATSLRLRALRRRLLGRAWRPVLLIPVDPAAPDPEPLPEDKPSASSR